MQRRTNSPAPHNGSGGRGCPPPRPECTNCIENALKQSDLTYTTLRPNNFYQNDHWFREAIQSHGVYPQPMGDVGLSRVDTRDVSYGGNDLDAWAAQCSPPG
jgi:hypothetical protein